MMTAEKYFNKGVADYESNNFKNAIENFNKAIEINQNYTDAYYNRGIAKFDLSDYHGAIEDYSKAIEINQNYADAYLYRGFAKFALTDYRGAIDDYSKLIEINPDYAYVYFFRGVAKFCLSDYHGAIDDYSKLIEIIPDYENAYDNRGIAKCNLKDYHGAIEDYNKSIEINPNVANKYYYKGLLLEELGKYKEAIESYECTLAIKPNDYYAATRRNIIILNMPTNEKEEYKNNVLKEFDKLLKYDFTIPFSNIDKKDVAGKLEYKMLNNINKNVVAAKQRIEEAVKSPKTDYEYQIAQCSLDEFPIVFTIYYFLMGKISSDTASILLLYCAKKMDDESIKKLSLVMRAALSQINILFAGIEFLSSIWNSFNTIKIWNESNEYDAFKVDLPIFLAEERKKWEIKILSQNTLLWII